MPIESVVLVEARVLRGNDSMLKVGRNLIKRNKFVAIAIRRTVSPGLQVSLNVYRGRRRVNPPGSHKDQRSKRPNQQQSNDDPSNNPPQQPRATSGPAV